MFHQPELSQLLNVGHVNVCRLGVHSDHVAAMTLLHKVQHHVIADSVIVEEFETVKLFFITKVLQLSEI